jgi:putative aminophosphonate oxidoreductase
MNRRSLWLGEALRGDEAAVPLEGEARADVCIVGGGFTGLWTAIHLKEQAPALDVLLIEKDYCGVGASGRNGGFVLSWWAKLLSLKKICGEEDAIHLAKASADNVAEIGAFCRAKGIDSHFRHDGWLWAATSPAQVGLWQDTMDAANRFQHHPLQELSPTEVATRTGSDRHIAGVFEPTAASVQPALLARGLRRVADDLGVRIHERTPMTKLQRGRPPSLHTPMARVRANKIVLAMNAWGIQFSELRRGIIVVASDIVATAAMPEKLNEIGYSDGLAISDGRMLVHYYRTTKDGRLVFGKGGVNGILPFGGRIGEMFDGPSRLEDSVARHMRRIYPNLGPVRVDCSWMGPIDRSKSGLPAFGPLGGHPDILYGIGYSGNGVGPCRIGGRILASLALEAKDAWSSCALVHSFGRDFPREPARYVGGHLVRRAVLRKDEAEDAGRQAGPLTSYIASFAPAGLSPFKGQKAGLDA